MSRSEQPVAKHRQVWIAGLVALFLALVWGGGTPLIKIADAGGSATTSSADLSPVDVTILTASGSTPRFPEFRTGHDPDDMALDASAACIPLRIGIDTVAQVAVVRHTEFVCALPQARAPPPT